MTKSNVVDLSPKLNKKKSENKTAQNHSSQAEVLDLTAVREEKVSSDRRKVTRTVLSQFVGVFVLIRDGILQPVQIYDISTTGLSFDLPREIGAFNVDESVTMRIYMTHDTYFSFNVKVANTRAIHELGVYRHGGSFKKTAQSQDEALYHFVRFLETVSSSTKKDLGERITGQVDL